MNPHRAFKTAAYSELAQTGKALSNSTRLEILELIAQAPIAVEDIARNVDQSMANTSHHLGVLKGAHLVKSERDGVYQIYAIASQEVGALVTALQGVAKKHAQALNALTEEHMGAIDPMEALDKQALLEKITNEGAVLIDVRPAHEYNAGHIDSAFSVPLDSLEAHIQHLPKDKCIVAYCRGPFCTFSATAVARLRTLGFDARRADISPLDYREML